MLLGNKIRSLRDEQGILQRQVAAYLEIDTPMFSKIERGDRRAKRSQVIQMATYFKVDEKEMLTLWLADKILSDLPFCFVLRTLITRSALVVLHDFTSAERALNEC